MPEITRPQRERHDNARRFGGIARLYGEAALARFSTAHVCVVGIGGVGSWVVEALARSAIGRLTLIDLDMVAESNVNRQLPALSGAFGKAKVAAMAERIAGINPDCEVNTVEDFVTPDNVATLLASRFDYVVDAIDQVRTKAAMIAHCRQTNIPIITAGSAGGQIDPGRIVIGDLANTIQDPLLSKVRSLLRKTYGFPRDPKKKFGIPAVYSTEPLRYPASPLACASEASPVAPSLNCAGFGSSVCITAPFGFFAAGEVLKYLAAAA
jgi:tRNA A37 threonylcarbamoyladenosine dehydratase